MLKFLISVAVILAAQFSFADLADKNCTRIAIEVAKENARYYSLVYSVNEVPAQKAYLAQYEVILVDSRKKPTDSELVKIILMRSTCSVVSVIPDVGQN